MLLPPAPTIKVKIYVCSIRRVFWSTIWSVRSGFRTGRQQHKSVRNVYILEWIFNILPYVHTYQSYHTSRESHARRAHFLTYVGNMGYVGNTLGIHPESPKVKEVYVTWVGFSWATRWWLLSSQMYQYPSLSISFDINVYHWKRSVGAWSGWSTYSSSELSRNRRSPFSWKSERCKTQSRHSRYSWMGHDTPLW